MGFYFFHYRRVVTNAGVETEVAPVDPAETDWFDVFAVDAIGEFLYGEHRIVWHAERPCKHVRAPSGKRAEGRLGTGDPGGDLVECAVAAESDDDIDTASSCVLGETRGMTAPVRLDDFHVVAA